GGGARVAEEADKRKREAERALTAARDLLRQKKYEEAIGELQAALALDKGNKEVRAALAEARRAADEADKRRKAVERALTQARDLSKQKKDEEAIQRPEAAQARRAGNEEGRAGPAGGPRAHHQR